MPSSAVEAAGDFAQLGLVLFVPVIEGGLQRRDRGGCGGFTVEAHDDQPAVSGPITERRELHAGTLCCPAAPLNRADHRGILGAPMAKKPAPKSAPKTANNSCPSR